MSQGPAIVGTNVVRIDAVEKVTGSAMYAGDLRFAGMLHAKTLRSPHPHARVVRVDTSKAEKLPGFGAVVLASEVPRVVGTWFNLRSEKELGKLFNQDDKVRFIGDPVLTVAAADEDTAAEALSLIDVEYEILRPIFEPLEALTSTETLIHDKGNVAFHVVKEYGDLEKGFAEADLIIENRYATSKQKQLPLEPVATCIADYSVDGRLTVHSSSQVPHWTQMYLALALQMPISKVRVIRPYVGGGFGARAGVVWGSELTCAFLARKARRPVRLAFSRKEDFLATETRHPFTITMKTGTRRDGTITANHAVVVMDTGGYGTQYKSVLADALGTGVGLYRIPNYTFDGTVVYTNKCLCGAMRGYGNPQFNFAQESQLDIIAHELGMDPIQLRLKNYRGSGELDPVFNHIILSDGMKECLSKGSAAIGWTQKHGARAGTETLRRGVGMACHQHGTGARFGLPDPSSAAVRINADGSVNLLTACADDGQGNRTVMAQIAAEVLGVLFESITVSPPDTGIAPLDGGTHGSRQTYCGGTAVMHAAADARAQVLAYAAEQLDRDMDQLTLQAGVVSSTSDPSVQVPLKDLMRRMQVGDFSLCRQIVGEASGVTEGQPAVFGATFAEVEVDTETGHVRVVNMVGAFDLGKAIFPQASEGQIEGGLVMGTGYALSEGLLYEGGVPQNLGFADYKIARANDAPRVTPILVESMEPTGPFGAKGLGEATMISSAAAIANAIYDAVGVRMQELRITPERILEALEAAGKHLDTR